jgi:xylulokinase
MDVVLGADVGTSGLKLVALGDDGAVVAEAESGYEPDRPRPGWAQSAVGTWVEALTGAAARLAPELRGARVRGLGLSGQMHGAVLVDDAGHPLAPALLWPDERAAAELARWRDLPAADRAALANPLVAGMTGPLAAWLAAHEPAVVDGAAALLLPKDAVRAALVRGAAPGVTDRSDASATLLWDVPRERWSTAALGAAGLPARLLPDVRPADEVVGTAELPGCGEVPVVVGGADTALALLATGSAAPQLNLGTGAQLLAPGWVPEPADDPPVHGYADAGDGWYRMAALRNAGSAWAWVCRVLGLDWPQLFAAAAAAPAGAGGVVFRPFLTGERGGVARPADRGSWSGLGPGTTREDLARAAVEGVAFAVAAAGRLAGQGGDGELLVTGGGARADVVRQLLADVLGRPVRVLGLRSASAVGAAVLAARGTGADVVPRRDPDPPVQPRRDPALAAAAQRWAAS